jgi:hypothetical protein
VDVQINENVDKEKEISKSDTLGPIIGADHNKRNKRVHNLRNNDLELFRSRVRTGRVVDKIFEDSSKILLTHQTPNRNLEGFANMNPKINLSLIDEMQIAHKGYTVEGSIVSKILG